MDRGAWRALIRGVVQSRTQLKWLSRAQHCFYKLRSPIALSFLEHLNYDLYKNLGAPMSLKKFLSLSEFPMKTKKLSNSSKQVKHHRWYHVRAAYPVHGDAQTHLVCQSQKWTTLSECWVLFRCMMGQGAVFSMRGTHVYLWLIHVDVWQKPSQ